MIASDVVKNKIKEEFSIIQVYACTIKRMAETNVSIVSISCVLCMLTAISQSQEMCEACGTEELRRAAMDKVLASVGCDNYACSKLSINKLSARAEMQLGLKTSYKF